MTASGPPSLLRLAALVFAAVLVPALASIRWGRQLGDFWNPDEWYLLGANLAVHGTLGLEQAPTVFRPPGYPAFVAAALRIVSPTPARVTATYLTRTRPALYVAQALVLAAAAAAAFLWWASRLGRAMALGGALALGANPYSLALVGLPNYGLLHLAFLVVGTWALHGAVVSRRDLPLFAAGLVWGMATLVRPVSLILPLFVAPMLRGVRPSWSHAAKGALVFALGLGCVVAPWTLRNYRLRQRFIPVNAQAWTVFWGTTFQPLPMRADSFNWYDVVESGYMPVFRRVTGSDRYTLAALFAHDVELEDAFRKEALRNLGRRPQTCFANAARSEWALLFQTTGLLPRLYEHVQRPGAHLEEEWFRTGRARDFERSVIAAGYVVIATLLLAPAAFGVIAALRARDRFLVVPAGVFASLAVAQLLSNMDLQYYYQRLPFLVLGAYYGFDAVGARTIALPGGRRISLGRALAGLVTVALATLGLALLAVAMRPELADRL